MDGVKDEFQFFFSNGERLRRDAVSLTLAKLQRLKKLLETQTTFCFYSCSLLLMYDGCSSEARNCNCHPCDLQKATSSGNAIEVFSSVQKPECPGIVDVRLIDFAHVSKFPVDCVKNSADDGILFGLESLISILQTILQSSPVTLQD